MTKSAKPVKIVYLVSLFHAVTFVIRGVFFLTRIQIGGCNHSVLF